jgi:hypothetical protein
MSHFNVLYKKIFKENWNLHMRRNTGADEKAMISSDNLIDKKLLKDDKEVAKSSAYHTLGHESYNLQNSQTLIVPYNDKNDHKTIQNSTPAMQSRESNNSNQQNAMEVDHRFSSEESENDDRDKDSDQEEVKVLYHLIS